MVSPRAQGYAAVVRPSWLNLWWLTAILGAPSVASALTWSVTDPVPSPAPDALAPIAQDWLAGTVTAGRWSPMVAGPIDARAVVQAGPAGTIYATSQFETTHSGPVAVRVRTDAAVRVWLDGRLIGGDARASIWTTTPIALPAAVEAGAHRLLIELRPAYAHGALLAATVTTPTGQPIVLKALANAEVREAALPSAPFAIRAVERPSPDLPAQVWQRAPIAPSPGIALPGMPDLDALRTLPRWPDADWSLLFDAWHWVLDTRQRARRVVGRVNAQAGLMAARVFLRGFDTVEFIGLDGPEPGSVDQLEVGTLFMATRLDVRPADPLVLGAARLRAFWVPVWRMAVTLEAPRGWTLVRRARGIGGARIVDDRPGRRQWQYRADAVAPGAATLRVSRAEGAAGFAQAAQDALRDHIRPYPGQPTCAELQAADAQAVEPLTRAITCARDGADIVFVRAAGRPALDGPVDLDDFDAIEQTLPSWAAFGLQLDGTITRGHGVTQLSVELTPDQPAPPKVVLAGPCGSRSVADTGSMSTRIDVRLAGVAVAPPRSRRATAGPLSHVRQVERTATGWRATHRLSWADLEAVSPARVAAACRQLAQP
ncbi:MAG: hypothetical protein ACI9U2_000647 [Bradymonadia bacterium]|jgi:hypothetical protein